MKKVKMILLAAVSIFILGACGSGNNTSNESSESSVAKEESTSQTGEQSWSGSSDSQWSSLVSVFTGVLSEDAEAAEHDGAIRLVLNSIEAVDDPEVFLPMMETDGVILNVSEDQLAEGLTLDQLKSGDKVQFTLTGMPAMTASIPPQVAGNAVKIIEKVN
ncbi:hypothetical protein IW492_12965 [Enterococcus sp. BWB1-3]|uniref:hypothetical protein n=1 Tax=unclassified Enterococcus TaxID=2608891 RepID=UPI0019214444|nr:MULTISPECIES: hypothetical protein [unclassified Enterococcus]MBL1230144.1 hypothetical protein [Enterococcus sp. BWB1-3]MCB5955588.1 hypothetical protein [Enterococcus sp. CWB-B31]